MILKENGEYILYDSTGERVLGRHTTRAKALAQEIAIRISKARRAGRRIPGGKK
jgi:hypothetical protein